MNKMRNEKNLAEILGVGVVVGDEYPLEGMENEFKTADYEIIFRQVVLIEDIEDFMRNICDEAYRGCPYAKNKERFYSTCLGNHSSCEYKKIESKNTENASTSSMQGNIWRLF